MSPLSLKSAIQRRRRCHRGRWLGLCGNPIDNASIITPNTANARTITTVSLIVPSLIPRKPRDAADEPLIAGFSDESPHQIPENESNLDAFLIVFIRGI
jgi:hypothetical protein